MESVEEMQRAIVARISEFAVGGASVPFSLLHDTVEGLWESELNVHRRTLVADINPQVVVWLGLTQVASEAFIQLFRDGVLRYKPCESRHYPKSLYRPPFPVISVGDIKRQLSEPHWFPVLLSLNVTHVHPLTVMPPE